MPSFPDHLLREWFSREKRDLPWRHTRDPYKIWVSEIMLQQTRVETVIPYYHRWMSLFPTIETLAKASEEKVLKAWEGLGYYSRALNLLRNAREILEKHNGLFPSDRETILRLKGIGPYTAGALLSFAFRQKSPLVDGNVQRVFARFFSLSEDLSISSTKKYFERLAEELLPDDEPWIFNEALMELGALVCLPKNPSCSECPLQHDCSSSLAGKQHEFPIKSQKINYIPIHRLVMAYRCGDSLLLRKNTSGVLQHLYEFPYVDFPDPPSEKAIREKIDLFIRTGNRTVTSFPPIPQSFTKYRLRLYPRLITLSEPIFPADHFSLSFEEMKEKPLSSGHKKFFNLLFMNS